MNIVCKVHTKVYKWKISTIPLNLQKFQGRLSSILHRKYCELYHGSQEAKKKIPPCLGDLELNVGIIRQRDRITFIIHRFKIQDIYKENNFAGK